jgi:hypothetical protein
MFEPAGRQLGVGWQCAHDPACGSEESRAGAAALDAVKHVLSRRMRRARRRPPDGSSIVDADLSPRYRADSQPLRTVESRPFRRTEAIALAATSPKEKSCMRAAPADAAWP